MQPLLDALKQRVLVGDGAYGTLLSARGLLASGGVGPVLNLTKPAFVQAAHQEYLDAGADVIETNTFAADALALAAAEVTAGSIDVCRAGAKLARAAAGSKAWVLGSVAPLFRSSVKLSEADRTRLFTEQVTGLVEGGVDAILLETFSDLDELVFALRAAKQAAPGTPVIAQMAFSLAGTTTSGISPERMVKDLTANGADVIGANCGGGESAALEVAKRITENTDRPVSIYPNRGLADFDELGRPVYIESHDYFARSARRLADLGVNLIGGCCGTTPDDIRKLKALLQARKPSIRHVRVPAEPVKRAATAAPVAMQPTLEQDLKTRRIVIAEVDPPRGIDASREIEGARQIVQAGADGITIADNPLSIMRMSNLAFATLLMREMTARIVLHIACRDRSLIGTQSHILGAHALGVSNILAVTGDPVATQAYQGSSGVFDMASHKLIELISRFNQGEFATGGQEGARTGFFVGGAFNCASRKLENEVKRFQRKVQAGARFIMTQPVFDLGRACEITSACRELNVPLVLGVMPLVSERNAEFLHHEVPGIDVPEAIRKRMAGLKGDKGRAEGIAIAKEMMQGIAPEVQGFYMITPMNRFDMIAELTKYAHSLSPANA
ncbi:MAG: bifunctional homocysteine S-methyltransferase/methylenetetrahydrofolate reductase [Planctomycetes bacterium]|nr:bifunctional homocysteine S-methyltransferase/methylenetetrahydrofolate reductase [Planctomycetota bacterium]